MTTLKPGQPRYQLALVTEKELKRQRDLRVEAQAGLRDAEALGVQEPILQPRRALLARIEDGITALERELERLEHPADGDEGDA